jgi:hypothetical protein
MAAACRLACRSARPTQVGPPNSENEAIDSEAIDKDVVTTDHVARRRATLASVSRSFSDGGRHEENRAIRFATWLARSRRGRAGVPAVGADGGAVVSEAACLATDLSPNDDGSSGSVQLPFEIDFYGQRYEQLWVNNNGNVTFDGPLSEYTPFGLADTSSVIIAPFFADVDTRGAGSDVVRYGYGTTTYEGRPAFCVNWLDVGYYDSHFDKLNSFQLLLVDRSDRRTGDVDIVFNYDQVAWETGDASDGVGGLGGARPAWASPMGPWPPGQALS